jgi:hypothetical protein
VNALLIDPDEGFERVEYAEVIPGITRSLTATERQVDIPSIFARSSSQAVKHLGCSGPGPAWRRAG